LLKVLRNFGFNEVFCNWIHVILKSAFLSVSINDKIHSKLSAWKASFLSMAGRVQLVRSVIHNMLMYSITLYSWPTSLIKIVEKFVWNFIWSGDVDKRKLVIISWKKVCRPYSQEGLSNLNKASNLKLRWSFF
jgi:hypothetical protein